MIPVEHAPLTAAELERWRLADAAADATAVVAAGLEPDGDLDSGGFVSWTAPRGIPSAPAPAIAQRLDAFWTPDAPAGSMPPPVRLAARGDMIPPEVVPYLLACPGLGSVVLPVERPPGALRRRPWSWPLRIGAPDEELIHALADARAAGIIPDGLVELHDVRSDPGAVDILVVRSGVAEAADFVRERRPVANAVVCIGGVDSAWPIVDGQLALIRAGSAAVLTAIAPDAPVSVVAERIIVSVRFMSHAHPIDVALTSAFDRSILLVGEPQSLEAITLPDLLRRRARSARRDVEALESMAAGDGRGAADEAETASAPEEAGVGADEPPGVGADSAPAPPPPPPGAPPIPPLTVPLGGIVGGLSTTAGGETSTGGPGGFDFDSAEVGSMIDGLDALAEAPFDHESGAASEAVDMQERLDERIDAAAADAPRVLQAYVGEPGALEPDMLLHAGETAVDVFIGPLEQAALAGEAIPQSILGFDDETIDSVRLTVVLAPLVPLGQAVRAEIDVPRVGRSDDARLVWKLPATGLVQARIMVLHRNRVLQTMRLSGRIGEPARVTERIVLWDQTATLDDRQPFDRTFVLNHAADRTSRVVSHADGQTVIDAMDEIQATTDLLRSYLLRATQLTARTKKTIDEATRTILIDVAVAGRELHSFLERRLKRFAAAKRIQIVSTRSGRFLPLELIYDRPAPDADAKVCPRWVAGEECGEHCFAGPDDISIVCPSVFWGMSRTIERQQAADDDPDGDAFRVRVTPSRKRRDLTIARPILAASEKVRPTDVKSAVKSLGLKKPVTTWEAWRTTVADTKPDLLVLMPHTDPKAHSIEISGKVLRKGNVESWYVTGDAKTAPVAVLFGCDTAGSEADPAGWAGLFLDKGAAVVFSTLTMLLGRHAAAMSEQLAQMLRDPARDGTPLGELVAEFRREAVRAGLISAIAVTAYGDADWKV